MSERGGLMKRVGGLLAAALLLVVAVPGAQSRGEDIDKMAYGTTADGLPIEQYVLKNGSMTVKFITYGGIITELIVPDRDGKPGDVVLGFDRLADYEGKHPYFGALVGRYANRIAKGKFELGGKTYTLATNDGPNSLHGGLKGFDKRVWKAEELAGNAVRLTYKSTDGEEGYPGNLTVHVTYTLTPANELKIEYEATTDAPTPINVTNHSYFNLGGAASGSILDHVLKVEADQYTPVDDTLIPTGEIAPVAGTPLDFTTPHTIGERIGQMKGDPGGYDHNLALRGGLKKTPALAVTAVHPGTGRKMEMYTTEPGVQFYSGNFLDGTNVGKGGVTYNQHQGFCLEAQHYPDSVHQAGFPAVILEPGQVYRQTTIYKFGVEE